MAFEPASVVTELRCCDVRWFYKPLSSKNWKEFIGSDSFVIEVRYRQSQSLALDEGTAEYISNNKSCASLENDIILLGGMYKLCADKDNAQAYVMTPIYWEGDSYPLLRCTWFEVSGDKVVPMEDDCITSIDAQHLKVFRGHKIPSQSPFFGSDKKPVIQSLDLDDSVVEWSSPIDVVRRSTSRSSKLARWIGRSSTVSLKRGYSSLATPSDCLKPVDHVIFVVHGIGQKQAKNRIVANTNSLNEVADRYLPRYFDSLTTRPLFLPVEWRSALKLDGDMVGSITLPHALSWRETINETAGDILYYTSPTYRSEIIDGCIGVLNRLHKLFEKLNPEFVRQGGKYSIFAHSLGTVICYDILTNYSPVGLYDRFVLQKIEQEISECRDEHKKGLLQQMRSARMHLEELNLDRPPEHESMLTFQVDSLFCVGSPLGVFLALRDHVGAKVLPKCERNIDGIPYCNRIYNIFHPLDPVAFRLEPLVHHAYKLIKPLKLHSHDIALKSVPYDELSPETVRKGTVSKTTSVQEIAQIADGFSKNGECSLDVGCVEVAQAADALSLSSGGGDSDSDEQMPPAPVLHPKPSNANSGWFSKFSRKGASSDKDPKKEKPESKTLDCKERAKMLLDSLPAESKLTQRLDFCLRRATTERLSETYAILRSHFCYWTNGDVVMFLLASLYYKSKM